MKLKTLVVIGGGIAVGYVLGTAAGRARFEELKARASVLAQDPKVQQTVSDIAGQVKANAHYAPAPFSGVVGAAAGKIQETLNHTGPSSVSGTEG
jgi:hypothetical protein